jgi:quercetin 2,3-dioxygenase
MYELRRSSERGHTGNAWLDSHHTFSFGDYVDQRFKHFGPLRVINEDRVAPGQGFDSHGHRDMEIITYVIEGALEHEDSLGSRAVVWPGDVQRISAGTGMRHSERNHLADASVHFLQVWIVPDVTGLVPSYEDRTFHADEKRGQLRLIAARDGRQGAVTIHQDADVYASVLAADEAVSHTPRWPLQWVQLLRGSIGVNGTALDAGDGLAIRGEAALEIRAAHACELLLFDLTDR